MDAKAMLAKDHAAVLVATLGHDKAEQVARDKLADAPFLANGDARFWRLTLASLATLRDSAR